MTFEALGYPQLFAWMQQSPLAHWLESVPQLSEERLSRHGDLPRWLAALQALPTIEQRNVDLSAACIRITGDEDFDEAQLAAISETLMAFHPWRNGPFCPCGIHLDT